MSIQRTPIHDEGMLPQLKRHVLRTQGEFPCVHLQGEEVGAAIPGERHETSRSPFSPFNAIWPISPVYSAARSAPCGLHVLRPRFHCKLASLDGTGKRRFIEVPLGSYERTVQLIRDFGEARVAWITQKSSPMRAYPPAAESRGLDLNGVLFLETARLAQSVHGICEEDFFNVIVVDGSLCRATLQVARKWTKESQPTEKGQRSSLPSPFLSRPSVKASENCLIRADALATRQRSDRLFVYLLSPVARDAQR